MNLEIVRASKKDSAEKIAELFNTVFIPTDFMATDEPVSSEGIVRIINNPYAALYLAIDKVNGNYVGFIYLLKKKSPEFIHRGFIQAVGVLPLMRNKGVGRMLLEKVIKNSSLDNNEVLTLEVVGENIPAIKLYEEVGMSAVGTIPDGFRKNGQSYSLVTYCIQVNSAKNG